MKREKIKNLVELFNEINKRVVGNNVKRELTNLLETKGATNIVEALEANARDNPDGTAWVELSPKVAKDKGHNLVPSSQIENKDGKIAVKSCDEFDRRVITWREFNEMANRIAHKLVDSGVQKGDHIAVVMKNSLEQLAVMFAVLKTGAVLAPINPQTNGVEVFSKIFENTEIKKVIFNDFVPNSFEIMKAVKEKNIVDSMMFVDEWCDNKRCDFAENLNDSILSFSTKNLNVRLDKNDDAIIFFTSGTTGNSKAAVHSHINIIRAAVREKLHHGQTEKDIFLCVPPLYHAGAFMHWLGSLVTGGKSVLLRDSNVESICQTIEKEKITVVFLLRPWAQKIIDKKHSSKVVESMINNNRLRCVHLGAQEIENEILEALHNLFPNVELSVNFGQTENAGPGTLIKFVKFKNGKVINEFVAGEGVEIRLFPFEIAADGSVKVDTTKDADQGVLAVRGVCTMKGFFKNEKATKETLTQDGWLITGDVFKKVPSDDGKTNFMFTDRAKDVIIRGGENVFPTEIEETILKHPLLKQVIQDIVVASVKDKFLGDRVGAIIQLKDGIEIKNKSQFNICLKFLAKKLNETNSNHLNLSGVQRPERIIFGDVPLNNLKKKDRVKARKILNEKFASQTEENQK